MNKVGKYCCIHPSVKLGKKLKIGSHVVIEEHCEIGDNTIIGNGVILRARTIIGKDCKIGTQAVSEGDNLIGDRVSCHAQSHMCRGLIIEDDVFFGPLSASFNTRKIVHGRKMKMIINGPTVKRAARIGGGVLLHPGITIGENALIGMGSVVFTDVPPREIWMGNPAIKIADVPQEEIL